MIFSKIFSKYIDIKYIKMNVSILMRILFSVMIKSEHIARISRFGLSPL